MRAPSSTICDSVRSRDEKEKAVAEALIRRRVEDLAEAIRAKNIDGVMFLYAPNIVSFDIDPINVEPGKNFSLHILMAPMRYATWRSRRRGSWPSFIASTV
jgi:hypothetical protein